MNKNPIYKVVSPIVIAAAASIFIGGAIAAVIPKAEPNDGFANAQNLNSGFSTGEQYGVENSATWQWVSVVANGNATQEYYTFTVPLGGAQVILDIDFTSGGLDTIMRLFSSSSTQLTANINSGGDPGSLPGESDLPANDSRISRTVSPLPAGTYYVNVLRYGNTPVQSGQGYTLNVSMLPAIQPLVADAGADFSVNEGDSVVLDGSASSGSPPLTYSWSQVSGGIPVSLVGADTANPSFTSPVVAIGGETLSFQLTVGSGTSTATDTVNVTIVNVNHPPVAEAGDDQSVAEGSPVTLHGEDSFDIDSDLFTYSWTQTGGPAVSLTGADGPNPGFEAPYAGMGGEAGVVATLVFELRVDDGYPPDAPAPGYGLENVVDTVTIEVTNTNNLPVADAGATQTVDENSPVTLSGAASTDPDGDFLTYSWIQEPGGIPVTIIGADTATPSFTAPSVSGTMTLGFTLTVDDGYGGTSSASVSVNVLDSASPPLADAAMPTVDVLWPPNHQMVEVGITGVTGGDESVTITITGVTQDEPTNAKGDGDTPIDAVIGTDGTVLIRSERSGKGNGRVYHIHFTATNSGGSTSGTVEVSVPHSKKKAAVDGGAIYDSTQ